VRVMLASEASLANRAAENNEGGNSQAMPSDPFRWHRLPRREEGESAAPPERDAAQPPCECVENSFARKLPESAWPRRLLRR
jgi:hypothetical protein